MPILNMMNYANLSQTTRWSRRAWSREAYLLGRLRDSEELESRFFGDPFWQLGYRQFIDQGEWNFRREPQLEIDRQRYGAGWKTAQFLWNEHVQESEKLREMRWSEAAWEYEEGQRNASRFQRFLGWFCL